ncbi:hypothetical protein Asi02nite_81360 [Asanoa siamensis]|uniref:HTH marR-type domain-containing protein n=2 Tax=Asanoa siamensis TaxID=926357 RepID=A0ABQ4D4Z2_9ACTN|nr:hypothetical protein Asi02nite_81360 [Asanoa siamensis]
MENDGLIVRGIEPADRRRVWVRLTPAGDAVFERHATMESDGEASLLSAPDAIERQTLAGLLRKLLLAADQRDLGDHAKQDGKA